MSDVLQIAWLKYAASLKKRPLATKAVTSACISGLSDFIAQTITGNRRSWSRTTCVALFGLLWSGPSAHYWQQCMERWFRRSPATPATVVKKTIVDQLSYGPLCNILFMTFAARVFEGRTLAAVGAKLRADYPRVQLQGWKMWPAVSLVNYWFVPVHLRVLVINLASFVWSLYLILKSKSAAAVVKRA